MLRRGLGAALLAITANGCFATRNDVRILQGDLLAFRAEAARADSARARQLTTIVNSLSTSLTALSDSIRDVSGRLGRFQGDTKQELRSVEEQLLQIQELTGQSQRRLQELRTDMETRSQPPPAPMPVAPGDTTKPPVTSAAPAPPGPNQLFLLATQQREQQSYSTARSIYEELLKNYPSSDLASQAQYWIAETLNAEGRAAEADSIYQLVTAKYPRTPEAARSMYKIALSLERQKKCVEAKAMMDKVAREFPQSDEAARAKEWTCTNR